MKNDLSNPELIETEVVKADMVDPNGFETTRPLIQKHIPSATELRLIFSQKMQMQQM